MSVKPIFAWYDCWVGAFWDARKRKLYILPIPCVGVVIEFQKPNNEVSGRPADTKMQPQREAGPLH